MEKETKNMKEYDVPFVGLKEGEHYYQWEVDNSLFENFGCHEFNNVSEKVELRLNKKSNLMEFHLSCDGYVNVDCDLSGEPYDQKVEGEMDIIVKFGEEYNDEDDELLIITNAEHSVNVGQYIYEMILLNVPLKRVHPGIEDGSFHPEILDKIAQLRVNEEQEDESEEEDDELN